MEFLLFVEFLIREILDENNRARTYRAEVGLC